jgi:hypothetical protein
MARGRSGFYRGRDGSDRLWFSPDDIEVMMESELQKAGMYPTAEKPVVDLPRFIGRHLKVRMDEYAELEPTVLGKTEFYRNAQPRIFINKDLTNAVDDDDTAPGLHGRWRATMAHEASHVLMHRVLFEVAGDQEALFRVEGGGPESQSLMRCLKTAVLFRGGGSDWREVQANLGMAALLMPRATFRRIVAAAVARLGLGPEELVVGSASTAVLAADVAGTCEVSKQAAGVRLETLGLVSPRGQRVIGGI